MAKLDKLKNLKSRFGEILKPKVIPVKKGKNVSDYDNSSKLVNEGKEISSFDNTNKLEKEGKQASPFSNLGKGSIPARNWCWEHAKKNGHFRHWILDDNIHFIYRTYKGKRIRCKSLPAFKLVVDGIRPSSMAF